MKNNIKIEIIPCLQDNYSYLIIDESKNDACVVDPSEAKPIINFIEDQSKLSYVKSIARWANKYMSEYNCESCGGSRLNKESTSYKVGKKNIKELFVR